MLRSLRLNTGFVQGYIYRKKNIFFEYAKTIVTETAAATKTESSSLTSFHEEPKWQLFASAFITRSPIISPQMKPDEHLYNELVQTKEIEGSLKSAHEIHLIEDKVRTDILNLASDKEVDVEEVSKQTAAEFEDISKNELLNFKFGPRVTDHSNNQKSLNRALDRSLVLVIDKKVGIGHHWVFPEAPWIPGETLRQTTERIIKDTCGSKLKVKLLGNSPCGFYKYKYPKEIRKQGYIGAKLFFFCGHVLAFDSEGLREDSHLWLTHEELKEKLHKSYFQAVSQFLISDH